MARKQGIKPESKDEKNLGQLQASIELLKDEVNTLGHGKKISEQEHQDFLLKIKEDKDLIERDHQLFLKNKTEEKTAIQDNIEKLKAEVILISTDINILVQERQKHLEQKNDIVETTTSLQTDIKQLENKKFSISLEIEDKNKELTLLINSLLKGSTDLEKIKTEIKRTNDLLEERFSDLEIQDNRLLDVNRDTIYQQNSLDKIKKEISDYSSKKTQLVVEIEQLQKQNIEVKNDTEKRIKLVISREQSASLLIETLNRKIEQVKTMGDVNVLKDFIKETFNK